MGNLLWQDQLPTSDYSFVSSITFDPLGHIYVTGTNSGLSIVPEAEREPGSDRVWLAKYDLNGKRLWVQEVDVGVEEFEQNQEDTPARVVVDESGNIYLTGSGRPSRVVPEDAWVSKYDPEGNVLWVQRFGGSNKTSFGPFDFSASVALDNTGHLYLTGTTNGDLGGINVNAGFYDPWIAKYDSNGNQVWIQQFGTTGQDYATNVVVDQAGNIYLSGRTNGDLGGINAGIDDAWIAKYDSNGNQVWIQQFGTNGWDEPYSMALDSTGNIYLTGSTTTRDGENNFTSNYWLTQYDANGNQLWIESFDTSVFRKIAVDSANNLYLSAILNTWFTEGDFRSGESQAIIAKLIPSSISNNHREIVGTEGDDTLFADVDDETIFGQAGNDILYGNMEDDTLFGDEGNDILYGDMGDDTLFEGGNDRLYGNAGDDILFGNAGNDTLYGGKGNDFLLGGEGDDLLSGDLGDDTLAGGNGRDIFVLQSNSGSDIILDFIDGEDFLELPANLSFTDLAIASNNGSTMIQLGDDTLATLSGVEPTGISEEDFISL